MFYAETQDGRQKWRENDFCQMLPVDSTDTIWVKNFVEITLSRSISKINAFFAFNAKMQDAFSALRKIVTFSKLLISLSFCIGSLPKVNDFQTSI